ncbi:MAG: hypothetical protein Q9166_005226 [cf. Caloplaca sp. 2 TL-2023]
MSSPNRSGRIDKNESSLWQIRITVQAEQNNASEGHDVPQCSPSKHFVERTITTTVPLKAEDESSPVRRKTKSTPRKPRNSSVTRSAASRSPSSSRSRASVEPSTKDSTSKPSPSPKRGRGRPRKSMGLAATTSSNAQNKNRRESRRISSMDDGESGQSPCKDGSSRLGSPTYDMFKALDHNDQQPELDSIMESEGFSMVSVSSLPSAQGSTIAPNSRLSLRESPHPSSKRHITPSAFGDSPIPPPPPEPASAQPSAREMHKPTTGTPRLARVVRAGIALQGVLTSARQHHAPGSLGPWINHSSPLSSAASPKDRLDELFSGFGPGTRRELRAGLRLGEELAKRQKLETGSSQITNEDVFAPGSEVQYPQLPDSGSYSLKVPRPAMANSPSLSNIQLPSPAESAVDADDDRMSWKFDTLQSNVALVDSAKGQSPHIGQSENNSPLINRRLMEKEAECQREREAISKRIQDANSSQVIVVDSDDENEDSAGVMDRDDGDIWQEEAQNSDANQPIIDIPPILFQDGVKKPRRSQLPSPWMRKSHDVLQTPSVSNDSDLFWQPSQIVVEGKKGKTSFEPSVQSSETRISKLSMVGDSSLSIDGASDDVNDDGVINEEDIQLHSSCLSIESQPEDDAEESIQQRKVTILDQSFDHSDSEDSECEAEDSEAEDSDDSLTDDENIESTLLSHHFMQEEVTGPLDEGTKIDMVDFPTSPTSAKGTLEGEATQRQPQTPSCLVRTPKPASSKKIVRFTNGTKKPGPSAANTAALQPAPLPPAPCSWLSKVTSLLPTWSSSAPAAATPLPSKPKKTIKLPEVDVGPLPCYMPWEPCHWWALIHSSRRVSKEPSKFPYDSKSLAASWMGSVVSVNQWAKKITKQDCSVVELFMITLNERGTYKGIEEMAVKAGQWKKQWGKGPGEWIDRRIVLSAVVAQWAVDVQDGVTEIGWGDRAGLKANGEGIWTKRDAEVDGAKVQYIL